MCLKKKPFSLRNTWNRESKVEEQRFINVMEAGDGGAGAKIRKQTAGSLKGLVGCGTAQTHRGNRFSKAHLSKAWSWRGLGWGKCHGTADFGEDWCSSFKDDSIPPRVRGHNAGSLPVPSVPWLHTCFHPCFCPTVPCAVLWQGGKPSQSVGAWPGVSHLHK